MTTADDTSFDGILAESEVPALIDFWAPSCAPCRALSLILEEVQAKGESRFRLIKVNADECTELAKRFNVRSLPTLVLVAGGKTLARKIGSMPKPALEDWIAAALSSEPAH